jgi:hypothetical protein
MMPPSCSKGYLPSCSTASLALLLAWGLGLLQQAVHRPPLHSGKQQAYMQLINTPATACMHRVLMPIIFGSAGRLPQQSYRATCSSNAGRWAAPVTSAAGTWAIALLLP